MKNHHHSMGCWLRTLFFYAVLFLLMVSSSVLALRSDATKMADFRADHVSFNEKNGTTIYDGHVNLQQGTTRLTADKVVVYKNADGSTNKVIATGNAHYLTLPDDQKDSLDAFGDTIEYYPQKQIAIIIGNGNVIQAMNSLKGPYIVYDMLKQTVRSIPSRAQGGAQSWITLQPWDLPGKKKITPQILN